METNSLPIEYDEFHIKYEEGKSSFCLHTRDNQGYFWDSCQDLSQKGFFVNNFQKIKVIDLKITEGYDNQYLTSDTFNKIKFFLENEQFIKTLHIQNWSWKKERESIFDMSDFEKIIHFLNDLNLEEHNVKLEIVNKENYIAEKYGIKNGILHFHANLNRYIEQIKKINTNNFIKIDFFHYVTSGDFSCWVPLKNNKATTSDIYYYNPTTKKIFVHHENN